MRRYTALSIVAVLIAVATLAYAQNYVPNQVLVKFRDGVTEERAAIIHKTVGTKVQDKILFGKIYVVVITNGASVEDTIKAYEKYPEIEFAEPNYIVKPMK